MNAYAQFNINLKDTLDTMKKNLEQVSGISREELERLLSGKSEREQREVILNKLIFETYMELKRRALNGKNGTEQVLEEAYEKICTEEKRKDYDEGLMKYNHYLRDWNKNLTNVVSSWEELQDTAKAKKEKMDPQNEFSQFSGAPYQWQVLAKNNVQKVVLDEMNQRNQRMIIMQLGKFQYSQLLDGPTVEKPMGQYTQEMKEADIIGVLKLNLKGEVIRNDVIVAKLSEVTEENKDFVKNEMFADERMDNATQSNHGFGGEITESANAMQKYRIHFNGKQNRDLVTALTWANETIGTMCLDSESYNTTFGNMKIAFSKAYQSHILKEIEKLKERAKEEGRGKDDE